MSIRSCFEFFFLGKKRGTQIQNYFTGSRSVSKNSNSLNLKYQMRIILRGRHLNLGVCMWSRELISVCSTLFPTHKHLWLWVHLARSRSTRRTSHLALHSHIQSVPLPVWRIKRKCYFHTNSCNTVMEKNYLKNYLGSYFSDFNLIFVSYGYFPDPTWHQANSYLPTLLSTSDRLAPKWFWQNWASKEVLFSLSSSSEVFFFLV